MVAPGPHGFPPMNVVIRACHLYPVKSCAGVPVESLTFDESGEIVGDREWVIVDERQCLTWMGAIPRLALVRPQLTANGWSLRAAAGGVVPLPPAGEGALCTVQAWNGARGAFDTLDGRDAGDAVAEFVSDVAGKKLRAVWLATSQHRPNPVHLTTVPSLHRHAGELGVNPEGMSGHRRFRPNLVLDAAPGEALDAFAEERVAAFTRPPLTLEVTGRCARCIMVDVDPDTADMDGRHLAGTKRQSARRYPGEPAYFGVYARACQPGRLGAGDKLAMQLRG